MTTYYCWTDADFHMATDVEAETAADAAYIYMAELLDEERATGYENIHVVTAVPDWSFAYDRSGVRDLECDDEDEDDYDDFDWGDDLDAADEAEDLCDAMLVLERKLAILYDRIGELEQRMGAATRNTDATNTALFDRLDSLENGHLPTRAWWKF